MNKNIRLKVCLLFLLCTLEAVYSQEKLNEFVITPDNNCPFTIRPGDGKYGFVVINTTLSDLNFAIPSAPKRLVVADYNIEKQQWVLKVVPNDSNYKKYRISINSKGFKQGEIEVSVKQKESLCFDVDPLHEVKQSNDYTAKIIVYDQDGYPLEGAKLTNKKTGKSELTNSEGVGRIEFEREGQTISITVSHSFYSDTKDIVVRIGDNQKLTLLQYNPPSSEAICLNTLDQWNKAINNRNEIQLASLYSGVVKYYQTCLTNNQVRDSHAAFFNKHAYFYQYYDNVTFDFINGCQAQVRFDKHVQTVKDGPYTTYISYLHMDLYGGIFSAVIIGESDVVTDKNLEKRRPALLEVDNTTPLNAIFCEANVNKRLDADYWDLVDMGAKEDGPLANFLLLSDLPRSRINGIIKKDFKGQKGTYYCGGFVSGGECGWPVIYIYNPSTHEMRCIGGDED